MKLNLDYYYGGQADQFTFYRTPKVLFTDNRYKSVSAEAKVLYSLLLDRMGLSRRNNWIDDAGHVYIYFTMEEATELMNCDKDKAVKLFKELDNIGLIERKKQGQGRPALIYVKNFVLPPESDRPSSEQPPNKTTPSSGTGLASDMRKTVPQNSVEVQTSENPKSETQDSIGAHPLEEPKTALQPSVSPHPTKKPESTHLRSVETERSEHAEAAHQSPAETQTSENPKSRLRQNRTLDFGKSAINNIEEKKIEKSETDLSIPSPLSTDTDSCERIDSMDGCRAIVMKNIEYEALVEENPEDQKLLTEYLELIVETVSSKRKTIRIGRENKPVEDVRDRMLMLTKEHILYVLECMKANTTHIKNIRAYLLTALFNAPTTIRQYQASQRQEGKNSISYGVVPEVPDEDMLQYIREFHAGLDREAEQ